MKTFITAFLLAAVFLLRVECENRVTKAMKKYQIIPDVVSNGTKHELEVGFYLGVFVHLGNELRPAQTQHFPVLVDWNADEKAFYTLIFTAPDGPSRANPKFREVIKWLVVNIPGKDISKGETLAEFIGAGPAKDAGLTRYVFFVYKQKGKEKFDEKYIDRYTFEPRKHYSTTKFVEKYHMKTPAVAMNFYQARYDGFVPYLYRQLNCCSDL